MLSEYIVIGLYMILLLALGRVFQGMNKNPDDFFRCGCKGSWWLVGVSNFMAGTSAGIFVSASGLAYRSGGTVLFMLGVGLIGLLIQALWLAKRFRRLRAVTGPELVRERYHPGLQQLYAWSGLVIGPLTAAIHLWALAIFGASIFDIPQEWIILAMGGGVIVYSTSGGRWAVMGTDFLQALVTIPITCLVAWLCLREVGGPLSLIEQIRHAPWQAEWAVIKPGGVDTPYSLSWLAAVCLIGFIATCSFGGATRYFPAKDDREASKAAWLYLLLQPLGFFIFTIPSISARFLYPELVAAAPLAEPSEAAYAVISLQLLPSGLTGLLVVALLASAMSTLDSGVNNIAAVFIKDVYPPLCRIFGFEVGDESRQLLYGRIYSVASGLLMVGIALYLSNMNTLGLFETGLRFHGWLAFPLLLPLCFGLFIKRSPAWSGFACLGAAFTTVLCLRLFAPTTSYPVQICSTFLAGLSGFALSMLFYRQSAAPYRQRVTHFFEKMEQPVRFKEEVGQDNDAEQLRLLGGFAIVIGAGMLLLLLLPGNAAQPGAILILSGAVLCLGLIFFGLGKR